MRLVLDEAGRPAFDTVIIGVRTVVALKDVSRAHPAIEHSHEDPVAAMRTIVTHELVFVRADFDEHTRRVPSMHLARANADSVTQDVVADCVPAGIPLGRVHS